MGKWCYWATLSWRWGLFFSCVLRVGAILHPLCILYYNILFSCYIDSCTFFFTNENLATWKKGLHEKQFIYLLVGSCSGQHDSLSMGWVGLQPWCALLESMSLPSTNTLCVQDNFFTYLIFLYSSFSWWSQEFERTHKKEKKKKKKKRKQQLFLVKLFVQEINK